MKVGTWAEVRRLREIERLSIRAIARHLRCGRRQVTKALAMREPPSQEPIRRGSILDPFKPKIDAILEKYPDLSAVRVREEIAKGEKGYRGEVTLVRAYLRKVRPDHRRVYSEVVYEPGDAMQVDFGDCGKIRIGSTWRKVYVFVAVLCFSRLIYIEFVLSQARPILLACLKHAFVFFGGSTRRIVFDNLRQAVVAGSGRTAVFHTEVVALCGFFRTQPVACEARDPESKGGVENGVKYVKRNALAGRSDELVTFADFRHLQAVWRDEVANVRLHDSTRERPVDRFERERDLLLPLPDLPFDTDDLVLTTVSPFARIRYDTNRYSVPPKYARKAVVIRASHDEVAVTFEGTEITRHERSYDRRVLVVRPEHELAKAALRRRRSKGSVEAAFAALGPSACDFAKRLAARPLKPVVHLRRILALAGIYGKEEVVAAIERALALETLDAAYVEQLLLAERRRRGLPQKLPVVPKRSELLEETDVGEADPAAYDQIFGTAPGPEE